MKERACDIAIVGGGPAGLAAALAAAEAKIEDIVVIEKKKGWGVPVQCAEYVPRLLARVIDIPRNAIAASVDRMLFFHETASLGRLKAPGYILHREIFESYLAATANAAGVTLLQPALVTRFADGVIEVLKESETIALAPRVVIGADGPHSLVRRTLGLASPPMALGLQGRYPAYPALKEAEVYTSPRYGAGYAWCFPKGKTANVGIAVDMNSASMLRDALAEFTALLASTGKILSRESSHSMGGLIPVGAPVEKTAVGNALLAGDAAGQTNPLNGAGIYSAIVCGRMAGETAAKALRKGDMGLLARYESAWRDLFGNPLERALASRHTLLSSPPEDYLRLFSEAWGIKSSQVR